LRADRGKIKEKNQTEQQNETKERQWKEGALRQPVGGGARERWMSLHGKSHAHTLELSNHLLISFLFSLPFLLAS